MSSEKFFFFFGNTKIQNEKSELTGAEIKDLIKDAVADFDVSHNLVLEGQGDEEDRVIGDNQSVSLEIDEEKGPRRFFSQPPANFGKFGLHDAPRP